MKTLVNTLIATVLLSGVSLNASAEQTVLANSWVWSANGYQAVCQVRNVGPYPVEILNVELDWYDNSNLPHVLIQNTNVVLAPGHLVYVQKGILTVLPNEVPSTSCTVNTDNDASVRAAYELRDKNNNIIVHDQLK